jgi:hypothetical protein
MNPSEQRFTDRLFKRVAALERQLQDIKTAQRIGLDNFVYDISNVASFHSYMPVGGEELYRINFLAEHPKYYAGELSMSFFFNNDLDDDYHWPDGAALTPASNLPGFDFFPAYDLWNSDETGAGRKSYYLRIINYGAVPKTVHTHIAQVFPKGNVT